MIIALVSERGIVLYALRDYLTDGQATRSPRIGSDVM